MDILIKVFDTTGSIVRIEDGILPSDFSKAPNVGTCIIQLPYNTNSPELDYYQNGYRLEIFIANQSNPSGKRVYSGEITSVDLSASKTERVAITASGYASHLDLDILEDTVAGQTNTVKLRFPDQELKQTVKDIIDLHRTNNGSKAVVNYDDDLMATTGIDKPINISVASPLGALAEVQQLIRPDYFIYVNSDNNVVIKEVSTTPDHILSIGQSITQIRGSKTISNLYNGLLFSNGSADLDPGAVLKLFEDTGSDYTRRWKIMRNENYKLESSINTVGSQFLDTYSQPLDAYELTVPDKSASGGYDIWSLEPYDTFKVNNIDADSPLSNLMVITNIDYSLQTFSATITATDVTTFTNRLLAESRQQINMMMFGDSMKTYYTT